MGAAIVRGGLVLAARRTSPPEAAGRWEFPGGKVEPGETPAAALVREIAEELGCRIEVTGWLDGVTRTGDGHLLTVARATLVRGEPEPVEHDAVRWLGPHAVDSVDWLEPDRPFLAQVRTVLLRGSTPLPARGHPHRPRGDDRWVRGIFFDEDAARTVAARLARDGFEATVVRERFAGDDGDLDPPWTVLTDAPELRLELLVDAHDGWLDTQSP